MSKKLPPLRRHPVASQDDGTPPEAGAVEPAASESPAPKRSRARSAATGSEPHRRRAPKKAAEPVTADTQPEATEAPAPKAPRSRRASSPKAARPAKPPKKAAADGAEPAAAPASKPAEAHSADTAPLVEAAAAEGSAPAAAKVTVVEADAGAAAGADAIGDAIPAAGADVIGGATPATGADAIEDAMPDNTPADADATPAAGTDAIADAIPAAGADAIADATPDAIDPSERPLGVTGDGPLDVPARADVERQIGARRIVERFGRYALAGGAVPVPALDIAAVAGVQVRMLMRLAEHYGAPLSKERARATVMTVMGSVAPHAVGGAAARLVGQGLPVVGTVAAMAGGGIAAHAITRVMGDLFIDHFEQADDAAALEASIARAQAG